MNCYGTLDGIKSDLGLGVTTWDGDLVSILEAASREIDNWLGRFFYVLEGTRYQTPVLLGGTYELPLDVDLLEVDALTTDSEQDGTYDGETWVENTDFWTWPDNVWPKTRIRLTRFGNYGFSGVDRYVKIVGSWGFGDGVRAIPIKSAGANLTAADATTTAATVSAIGQIQVGHTLLVEAEQMFVSAVSGTNLTVKRAVNGTTGAAHAAAAASIYEYPADIARFGRWLAAHEFKTRASAGFSQERMGDYFYTRMPNDVPQSMLRCLGPYRRCI